MSDHDTVRSGSDTDRIQKEANTVGGNASASQSIERLFSPRFKSVAAMAGWDEESILIASLIVEDTPDRNFKQRKRSDPLFKTPPSTNSRRKRRVKRSPFSVPVTVLNLDEEEPSKPQVCDKKKSEAKMAVNEKEKKAEKDEVNKENAGASCSNVVLPCLDKLREELSCAICLEICYEPSTTSCGHSFCKKCLRSAADKCGKKCPKCRQLISNGRSCSVNTVLWNTIQLLFPKEVEARKESIGTLNSRDGEIPQERVTNDTRRSSRAANPSRQGRPSGQAQNQEVSGNSRRFPRAEFVWLSSRNDDGVARRGRGVVAANGNEDSSLARRVQRGEELARLLRREAAVSSGRTIPSQDGDAALALRLQRQEFMEGFRETEQGPGRRLLSARENLRAMASRAVNVRSRVQHL
ncbi:Tripartite motif-containing protein 65 [Linum perenne]